MLLIIKTGDETGHSVALRLGLIAKDNAHLSDLLETAIVVTGNRNPDGLEPWVEVKGVRPAFEIVCNSSVTTEPF